MTKDLTKHEKILKLKKKQTLQFPGRSSNESGQSIVLSQNYLIMMFKNHIKTLFIPTQKVIKDIIINDSETKGDLTSIAKLSDQYFLSSSNKGVIKKWDILGVCKEEFSFPKKTHIGRLITLSDKLVAVSKLSEKDSLNGLYTYCPSIYIINLESKTYIKLNPTSTDFSLDNPIKLSSQYLAVTERAHKLRGISRRIKIYDVTSGECIHEFESLGTYDDTGLCLLPPPKTNIFESKITTPNIPAFASCSNDGTIKIWDVMKNEKKPVKIIKLNNPIWELALLNKEHLLFRCNQNRNSWECQEEQLVKIYNFNTNKTSKTVLDIKKTDNIDILPNNQLLALTYLNNNQNSRVQYQSFQLPFEANTSELFEEQQGAEQQATQTIETIKTTSQGMRDENPTQLFEEQQGTEQQTTQIIETIKTTNQDMRDENPTQLFEEQQGAEQQATQTIETIKTTSQGMRDENPTQLFEEQQGTEQQATQTIETIKTTNQDMRDENPTQLFEEQQGAEQQATQTIETIKSPIEYVLREEPTGSLSLKKTRTWYISPKNKERNITQFKKIIHLSKSRYVASSDSHNYESHTVLVALFPKESMNGTAAIARLSNTEYVSIADDGLITIKKHGFSWGERSFLFEKEHIDKLEALSPSLIAAGQTREGRSIYIIDLKSDKHIELTTDTSRQFGSFAKLSSQHLISVNTDNKGTDNRIQLWDVTSGKCINEFSHPDAKIKSLHSLSLFQTEASEPLLFASCAEDGTIMLWKQNEPAPIKILNNEQPVLAIYQINKNEFLSIDKNGVIKVWSINTGKSMDTGYSIKEYMDRSHSVKEYANMDYSRKEEGPWIFDAHVLPDKHQFEIIFLYPAPLFENSLQVKQLTFKLPTLTSKPKATKPKKNNYIKWLIPIAALAIAAAAISKRWNNTSDSIAMEETPWYEQAKNAISSNLGFGLPSIVLDTGASLKSFEYESASKKVLSELDTPDYSTQEFAESNTTWSQTSWYEHAKEAISSNLSYGIGVLAILWGIGKSITQRRDKSQHAEFNQDIRITPSVDSAKVEESTLERHHESTEAILRSLQAKNTKTETLAIVKQNSSESIHGEHSLNTLSVLKKTEQAPLLETPIPKKPEELINNQSTETFAHNLQTENPKAEAHPTLKQALDNSIQSVVQHYHAQIEQQWAAFDLTAVENKELTPDYYSCKEITDNFFKNPITSESLLNFEKQFIHAVEKTCSQLNPSSPQTEDNRLQTSPEHGKKSNILLRILIGILPAIKNLVQSLWFKLFKKENNSTGNSNFFNTADALKNIIKTVNQEREYMYKELEPFLEAAEGYTGTVSLKK